MSETSSDSLSRISGFARNYPCLYWLTLNSWTTHLNLVRKLINYAYTSHIMIFMFTLSPWILHQKLYRKQRKRTEKKTASQRVNLFFEQAAQNRIDAGAENLLSFLSILGPFKWRFRISLRLLEPVFRLTAMTWVRFIQQIFAERKESKIDKM